MDLIKNNLRFPQDNFETNSHDYFRTYSRFLLDNFIFYYNLKRTFLPSSATTKLNTISTQPMADVSLIPTFSSHPPMTVVSMEIKLKTLSRLPQDYFKTIFRLIQFN